MMCRALERNTAEELKARSHRGMVECTVEYANKYRGSPPKTGILLFLSETVIAGRNSVPTAKQVLNTPGATIFCDLGNGPMKDLFMILRGYGLNELSPKDLCTINGLIDRKAAYVGDIIEAVLYWARCETEYELELTYFQAVSYTHLTLPTILLV